MKIGEAFPSNFLKADDLQGKDVIVTIKEVTLEELGKSKEQKIIIAFKGKDKKMVCNKTNAKTIAKLHGDDTDDWVGKSIVIGPREVEFQGDQVWAIRVSLRNPSQQQAQARPATARVVSMPEPSDNDGANVELPPDDVGF